MRIVIAGAGEVGTHLARMLSREEQNIILMDSNEKRIEEVKPHIEALSLQAYTHCPLCQVLASLHLTSPALGHRQP